MRLLSLPVLILLTTACGASWEVVGLDALAECTPEREKQWFTDADGDGWGTMDEEAQMFCVGDQTEGLVRNDLDCADDDSAITARVGAFCPSELVPVTGDGGGAVDVVGVVSGGSEFIAFFGDTDLINSWPADGNCSWWGHDSLSGQYWTPDGMTDRTPIVGALATFADVNQFGDVRDAVAGVESGGYAGFIGVVSNGTGWEWEDGTPGTSIANIGWCNAAEPDPALYDYAALVLPEGASEWCLSTPELAGEGYSWDKAHFVCERNVPDPAEYKVFPAQGAVDDEPAEE